MQTVVKIVVVIIIILIIVAVLANMITKQGAESKSLMDSLFSWLNVQIKP